MAVYAIDPVKLKGTEYPRMASDFSKIATNATIPSWEKNVLKEQILLNVMNMMKKVYCKRIW